MRSNIFLLLLLNSLAMKVDASVPNIDSLESRAERFVSLCNKADGEALVNFFKSEVSETILKTVPAKEMSDFVMDHCLDHGGFRILNKEKPLPNALTVTLRGKKTDLSFELSMSVDSKEKLEMPSLDPMPLTGWDIPTDLSDEGVGRAIKNEVKKLGENGIFSGIVVIARGPSVWISEAFGYADRKRKTEITPTTQFTLASLSKLFTAVATGQLVDQKKLSFDSKVGAFFPNYPNKDIREKATVGMLLSHRAGLGDFLDRRPPSMLKEGWTRAESFITIFAADELEYAPGSRQAYSNSGFALAGAIVEKASGIDFPSYVRRNIFEASGMKASEPNNIPFRGPNLVTPYTRKGAEKKPNHWKVADADLGSPAGGAISTALDLVKFADALRTGKLVSKETLVLMQKPQNDDGSAGGYGYGVSTVTTKDQTWVGHNGGYDGVSTELTFMPSGPYTVVILENRDSPASEWIGSRIRAILSTKLRPNSK